MFYDQYPVFYFNLDKRKYFVPKIKSSNIFLDKNTLKNLNCDLRDLNKDIKVFHYIYYEYKYDNKKYVHDCIKNNYYNNIDYLNHYLRYIKSLFYLYYIYESIDEKNKNLAKDIFNLKVIRVIDGKQNFLIREKDITEYFLLFNKLKENIERFSDNFFESLNDDFLLNNNFSYSYYSLPIILTIIFNKNFDFFDEKNYFIIFNKCSFLFKKDEILNNLIHSIKQNFSLKEKRFFRIFGNKILCIKTKNNEMEYFLKILTSFYPNLVFEKINKNYFMEIYNILR